MSPLCHPCILCHPCPRLREGKLRQGSIFSVCHTAPRVNARGRLDAGSILRFFLPPAVSRVLSGYSYYRPTTPKRCGKSNLIFNPKITPPTPSYFKRG